jgi:predicted flap endonuclease-1-like 5' DNA nuclease
MSVHLRNLKGVPYELQVSLISAGLTTYSQIHQATRTAEQRQTLAEQLEVDPSVVRDLAGRADLACLKGVGGIFARLLAEAGIKTVEDLAGQDPLSLSHKLMEVNEQTRLAGRVPTLRAVADWVAQAKTWSNSGVL